MKMRARLFLPLFHFCRLIAGNFNFTQNGDSVEYSTYMNELSKLYDELFSKRNYNKQISPVYISMSENATEIPRFAVNFVVRYVKMFNLDANGQILSLCFEYILDWRDSRLAWDPSDYSGVSLLVTAADNVWVPDMQFGNVRTIDTVHPDTPRSIQIHSNGTLTLPIVVYIEAACTLKVGTFPFDSQLCPIPIGSLTYDFKYSYMTAGVESINLDNPGNGEWLITNVTILNYMQSPTIQVVAPTFELKRVPNYYVYVIALPCFVMTMLAIIGMFWTPIGKSEQLVKLSIGLTSLVSMTVLLDMLSSSIPKTSVFPLLGVYVVICVGITSMACVVVVLCAQDDQTDPPIKQKAEKRKESVGVKTSYDTSLLYRVKTIVFQRHFALQFIFQTFNFTAFIVFLSFWD